MKFEIHIARSEHDVLIIEADDHDKAYAKAMEHEKVREFGFVPCDDFAQISDGGEVLSEHSLWGTCENCERRIWNDAEAITDSEGVTMCIECMRDTAD